MNRSVALLFLCLTMISRASAQSTTQSPLFKTLKAQDSLLFNEGYNHCDLRQFDSLLSEDFEFYHDEAGITETKAAFIAGIRDGLCKLSYKPKRVLVPGSLAVFPLKKGDTLYGGVQTGRHRFYAIEQNGRERLTSTARFTSLWLLQEGRWRLSRCFSYDHRQPRK